MAVTTTPQSVINDACRSAGRLASGEIASGNLAIDALGMLNDLIDQWSSEHLMAAFYTTEIIWEITGNVYQYTIGPQGTINATFTASIAPGSVNNVMTVSALGSGFPTLGMTVSGGTSSGTLPIIAFGTGSGYGPGALGTYILGGTQQTVAPAAFTGYYERPLRIASAFVRINSSAASNIDYQVAVLNVENYIPIGLKSLNGPWPRALYYQPSIPNGNVTVWPQPSQGEMHMFADTMLQPAVTLQDQWPLPQGMRMALRWNLATYLLPEFGKKDPTQIEMIANNAAAGRAWVKRNNMQPVQNSRFDDILVPNRYNDASWILDGGFNR